jgi:hypothetical protein
VKSLEALLRGYFLFSVAGPSAAPVYYWTYARAKATKDAIADVPCSFAGLHVFKGWRCFFLRCNSLLGSP